MLGVVFYFKASAMVAQAKLQVLSNCISKVLEAAQLMTASLQNLENQCTGLAELAEAALICLTEV